MKYIYDTFIEDRYYYKPTDTTKKDYDTHTWKVWNPGSRTIKDYNCYECKCGCLSMVTSDETKSWNGSIICPNSAEGMVKDLIE